MYLKAFAEMQACLICSVCQCWLFYNLKISYWFRTVSRSAALCLSSVLHLFCLHLSPFTFLEICLILCTWNIHFLSPFQALTDVCACFLWVLVMCRGRCCVFLPAILSFSPLCLSLSHSLAPSCAFIPSHSFVNLLLQREQMSILSDVPCTNHPHTDRAQRRRLAQLKHVQCKYPCVCSAGKSIHPYP